MIICIIVPCDIPCINSLENVRFWRKKYSSSVDDQRTDAVLMRADGTGYAVWYFPSSIETAITRNEQRLKSIVTTKGGTGSGGGSAALSGVTEQTIRRMAAAFESPLATSGGLNWESNLFVSSVDLPKPIDTSSRWSDQQLFESLPLDRLFEAWFKTSASIPPPLADASAVAAQSNLSRSQITNSLVHRADIAIRKLISQRITSSAASAAGPNTSGGGDKSTIANRLNDERKRLLAELKDPASLLSVSLTTIAMPAADKKDAGTDTDTASPSTDAESPLLTAQIDMLSRLFAQRATDSLASNAKSNK